MAVQNTQLRLILHYTIYALLPQKLATAYQLQKRAKSNIPVCPNIDAFSHTPLGILENQQ